MADEARIFEGRSVYASHDKKGWVNIEEAGAGVRIVVEYSHRVMTPDEADRLARGLRTMAARQRRKALA